MSKKRKGKYSLLEAIDFLDETTIVGNYPADGTGVSDGDDTPTSNILMAPRYKKILYYNRLTSFDKNWDHDDSDWYWDDFKNAQGQEDLENYSNTLKTMKNLFPKDTWKLAWKRMKNVSDKEAEAKFRKAKQPYRKADDQLGKEKEASVKVKNEKSSLTSKIDCIII